LYFCITKIQKLSHVDNSNSHLNTILWWHLGGIMV
jgi:hypothetical protein